MQLRSVNSINLVVDTGVRRDVPLTLDLQINLVGLEDTEPRVAPSSSWESCLGPPPPS